MTDTSFISINNLSKHFGTVNAVDDVVLDIGRGEFFALLGPSGCGKTTLLRMLAGFEMPSLGEIVIDGEETASVPPYKRPVNMVFQSYAIFPHLNVFQNIAFGLRKERLPKEELERRVNESLGLIKMQGYGERKADELSGGQRQRVALARALIKKPKVLLLDEPLGALDKKLREQMQLELRQLQKSVGITFVFVTHDQEEALTMSDRIAVMASGKVLEVGTPSELYERPRTRFVADFLGTMNFFDGEIMAREDDGYRVDVQGLGSMIVPAEDDVFDAGEKVSVALRPENIQILESSSNTGNTRVNGTMIDMAYLGDRAHIYVRLADVEKPVSVAMQNLDGVVSKPAQDGGEVCLSWSRSSVLLLKNN